VIQYRTHTTETLNYLADYLEEFHVTKHVFTAYRRSKATDGIAHAHTNDKKMQLKAEYAIEDEEGAKPGGDLSPTQKEHRMTEDNKCLQEVNN